MRDSVTAGGPPPCSAAAYFYTRAVTEWIKLDGKYVTQLGTCEKKVKFLALKMQQKKSGLHWLARRRHRGCLLACCLLATPSLLLYMLANIPINHTDMRSSLILTLNMSEIVKGTYRVDQEHPALVQYVRTVLRPPPADTRPLVLSAPIHDGQVGQVKQVLQYFNNKKEGFFIEAGAWDGEYLSNTLYLEANLSWSGLLVEPNSGAFTLLETRNRKATLLNSCLAVNKYAEETEFDAADVMGGIVGLDNPPEVPQMRNGVPSNMRSKYRVQCFPLYTLILAMGNPRIDFLSLDIEGAELMVLQTVPWHRVYIQSILVEVEHSDSEAITRLLVSAGYKVLHRFGTQDIFYVKDE